ncbi:hypothetical protein DERP_001960 [Dermatophagoides pteronyssinus]|uniref:Uncharacterized protein n=1 Tax=Dermatophagoides pteronyssinus TaxID=6956 RepID=A0ABQ8JBX2_DERPT|nr:hypothetical protein DERP_001960 [Dermatophagoides pteronyssinus]
MTFFFSFFNFGFRPDTFNRLRNGREDADIESDVEPLLVVAESSPDDDEFAIDITPLLDDELILVSSFNSISVLASSIFSAGISSTIFDVIASAVTISAVIVVST